jgi:uncharacterized protein
LFTPEILNSIQQSVLCWLATVDADGQPTASPKEVFCTRGHNELLIAHIASPGSAKNIQSHAKVCVSFLDIFAQKGHKLLGTASVIEASAPEFAQLATPLLAMVSPRFPIRAVFKVTVIHAQQILAPSYRLIEGTTEQSQRLSAYKTYGVKAVND